MNSYVIKHENDGFEHRSSFSTKIGKKPNMFEKSTESGENGLNQEKMKKMKHQRMNSMVEENKNETDSYNLWVQQHL